MLKGGGIKIPLTFSIFKLVPWPYFYFQEHSFLNFFLFVILLIVFLFISLISAQCSFSVFSEFARERKNFLKTFLTCTSFTSVPSEHGSTLTPLLPIQVSTVLVLFLFLVFFLLRFFYVVVAIYVYFVSILNPYISIFCLFCCDFCIFFCAFRVIV